VRRIATDCRPHQVLDQEHYGLSSVKRRIYEHLAVVSLRQDTRGPILCVQLMNLADDIR